MPCHAQMLGQLEWARGNPQAARAVWSRGCSAVGAAAAAAATGTPYAAAAQRHSGAADAAAPAATHADAAAAAFAAAGAGPSVSGILDGSHGTLGEGLRMDGANGSTQHSAGGGAPTTGAAKRRRKGAAAAGAPTASQQQQQQQQQQPAAASSGDAAHAACVPLLCFWAQREARARNLRAARDLLQRAQRAVDLAAAAAATSSTTPRSQPAGGALDGVGGGGLAPPDVTAMAGEVRRATALLAALEDRAGNVDLARELYGRAAGGGAAAGPLQELPSPPPSPQPSSEQQRGFASWQHSWAVEQPQEQPASLQSRQPERRQGGGHSSPLVTPQQDSQAATHAHSQPQTARQREDGAPTAPPPPPPLHHQQHEAQQAPPPSLSSPLTLISSTATPTPLPGVKEGATGAPSPQQQQHQHHQAAQQAPPPSLLSSPLALISDATPVPLLVSLSQHLARQGRRDEAREVLLRAAARAPSNGHVCHLQASPTHTPPSLSSSLTPSSRKSHLVLAAGGHASPLQSPNLKPAGARPPCAQGLVAQQEGALREAEACFRRGAQQSSVRDGALLCWEALAELLAFWGRHDAARAAWRAGARHARSPAGRVGLAAPAGDAAAAAPSPQLQPQGGAAAAAALPQAASLPALVPLQPAAAAAAAGGGEEEAARHLGLTSRYLRQWALFEKKAGRPEKACRLFAAASAKDPQVGGWREGEGRVERGGRGDLVSRRQRQGPPQGGWVRGGGFERTEQSCVSEA